MFKRLMKSPVERLVKSPVFWDLFKAAFSQTSKGFLRPLENLEHAFDTGAISLQSLYRHTFLKDQNRLYSLGNQNNSFASNKKTFSTQHNNNNKATYSTHSDKAFPSVERKDGDHTLPHPIWKDEYVYNVKVTHRQPESLIDYLAYYTIQTIRFNFDWMSGYAFAKRGLFGKTISDQNVWLNRIIFLESIAGVPPSIAASHRHLRSLRNMQRDHGWIHTLLEEAENERMHLLTAIALRKPGGFFRTCVWLSQGVFYNFYWFCYMLSPSFCHRLVGYLEEEAVKTYEVCFNTIEKGLLWKNTPAPEVALKYWKLPADAKMREVIAMIRADEAHHRDVNHKFGRMSPDEENPHPPGL